MASVPVNHNEDVLLRAISDGTASETGKRFFRALVQNLSQVLGTHGAWVTEYLPKRRRLRSLAFWLGGEFVDYYEYDVQGTPCEKLLREKKYLHIPDKVVDLFPQDPDLSKIGAVSYIGFPLLGEHNEILGNIAVVDTQPIPDSFRNLALFRIFAARATAELLRLRIEAELKDREEKLRGIFEGALDAIIELDKDFRIIMMNPSARKLFALADNDIVGNSFAGFLVKNDFQRLTYIIDTLNKRPHADRNIWIPKGLAAINSRGEEIRTEATLSQLEMKDAPCYVLICRHLDEQYQAFKIINSLKDETRYLRDEIKELYDQNTIIGRSEPFRRVLRLVSEVAPTDSTVLLYGETGTGKELIARAIHAASSRRQRPMITVNCAAIPESLMESEFFGHEKGAFTGATQRREGRFSLADGGTIFLDEIGDLSLELQSKLLRVLQEGEFAPVGSSRNIKVDVRVIAATNRDLSLAVRQATFRTDLYYRLNVFPVTIPPLRMRTDDIGPLAAHFVEKYAALMAKHIIPIPAGLVERLKQYDWPGNVRELQNVIERGVITARHGLLNLDYALPQTIAGVDSVRSESLPSSEGKIMPMSEFQQLERKNLMLALQQTQWRVAGKDGAARLLGLPPSTLQSRMKALGIRRPDLNIKHF
ncbi:sigma-54 interaction domain-containing protein [Desulfopila inferna]|uniref:sigma-54 interaction domain-containing protein n=1 Tax=Desulfopila inferna TaxID=468528 RepID=UPI00196409F4|nr:sigma 54-interacting transcriptional regulator [Desulfopila inferna]MBM9604446.1 sigma 54-interacting transcriptional regulator [Desulfopila inferna]